MLYDTCRSLPFPTLPSPSHPFSPPHHPQSLKNRQVTPLLNKILEKIIHIELLNFMYN